MKCVERWRRKRKGREAKQYSISKGTKSNQKNEKKISVKVVRLIIRKHNLTYHMIKSFKIIDLLSNIYSYIFFVIYFLLDIFNPQDCPKKTSRKEKGKRKKKKGNKSNKEKLERTHEVLMFHIILSLYNLIRY